MKTNTPLLSLLGGLCLAACMVPLPMKAESLTLTAAADTFINSRYPDNNAGAGGTFDVGSDAGKFGAMGTRRGLVRFDLSTLPAGITVTSVVLQLTVAVVPPGGFASSFEVRRVNAAWGEGVQVGSNGGLAAPGEATWNARQFGANLWTTPGAKADAAAGASANTSVAATLGATGIWSGPGLVADVQTWANNPSQNFGWLVVCTSENTPSSVLGFNSRESGPGAPMLQIGYSTTNPTIPNPIAARIPKGSLAIELQTVVDGLAAPLGTANPDDGSGRMFLYDQNGKVWVVAGGQRLAPPLLDVSSRLVLQGAYDERGLLGFAAHPNFAQNPYVYTYTSEPTNGPADFANGVVNDHQSVIAEWRITAGSSNIVDLSSRREILRIDEPQSNHNGGAMHFGPDGFLYITLGDGGNANDVGTGHVAGGNAQDLSRIWGKMLRIDVNGSNSSNGKYGIPPSNPFVAGGGLPEIYAYGLRNPFAFSFDRSTGALYLADVGQKFVEEVDIITAGGNYGWNTREGTFWFNSSTGNDMAGPTTTSPAPGMIDPIAVYDHDDGLAAIGGYVYRGTAIPGMQGRYVYGDWGSFSAPSGRLFYLDANNTVTEFRIGNEDRQLGFWIRGFAEGPDGELYVLGSRWLGPSGTTGRMMKIVPLAPPVGAVTLATAGTGLSAGWSGGNGLYAVQRKNALLDPVWLNTAVTNGTTASLTRVGSTGFYRVGDASRVPPVPFTAWMTGAGERPANTSTGSGFGIFALSGNTLSFNLRYTGLTANATAGHIHGPASAGVSGPVLIDLAPYNGGSWSSNGTLSGVILLSDAQKTLLMSGATYVNLHTANNPAGEIRGQIAPVNLQIALDGSSETPAVNTSGKGLGNAVLVGNRLTLNLTYRNLSSVANNAHIHGPALPGQSAGVLVGLGALNGGAWGTSGTLSGTVTLTPDQLASVVDGLTYINVHTATNPGGEIRGQIVPQVNAVPLTAFLSGLAEKPTSLVNTASGSGTLALEGTTLTFNIVYSGLSGTATGAHIHGITNTTGTAGILVDLSPFNGGTFGSSGSLSGSTTLTTTQRDALLNGFTYINFHTAANPQGEMRGQVAAVLMNSGLSGNNESTPVATPGSGSATFALVRDQLAGVVTYRNLTGSATASHIHGPASLFASGSVLVDLAPYVDGAFGTAGSLSGFVPLTIPQLLSVIDGSTYVNFHTPVNANGEIRGQIMR